MKKKNCLLFLYIVFVVAFFIFTILQNRVGSSHVKSSLSSDVLLESIAQFNMSTMPPQSLHIDSPKKIHRYSINNDWLLHSDWCRKMIPQARRHLFITPVEGFGNRIRAIVASHYIAFLTGRELNILWPEMSEFIQEIQIPSCVKWVQHTQTPPRKCTVLDCHADIAKCIRLFTTQSLQEIFPESEPCIHLVSYTAWELYLLDNPSTYGALLSVTQKIPVSVILKSFTDALNNNVSDTYRHIRARLSTSPDSRRHIILTLHIRTGADRYDGGTIKNLYLPQLKCAAVLQDRLAQRNMSSSIFIESDSPTVKSIAASMSSLSSAFFLDGHAERADLRLVIILWMLLGDGDVFLGSHGSSLSRTAAQRTGTTLYQLPDRASFAVDTPNSTSKSLQCLNSALESTKTHDAVFILIPTECAEIYPACPGLSVVDAIT